MKSLLGNVEVPVRHGNSGDAMRRECRLRKELVQWAANLPMIITNGQRARVCVAASVSVRRYVLRVVFVPHTWLAIATSTG